MSFNRTNDNIKANNKMVKKQYKYDRQMRTYSWKQSLDNYERAQDLVDLNVKNDQRVTDYRNQTNADNYNYQTQLQVNQYKDQVEAYNRSVEDFKTQKGLNKEAYKIGLDAEKRQRSESLIANLFENRADELKFDEQQTALGYEKNQQKLKLAQQKTQTSLGKQDIKIQQKAQDKIFSEQQKIADLQINQLDNERIANQKSLTNQLDQLNTDRQLTQDLNEQNQKITDLRKDRIDKDKDILNTQMGTAERDREAVSEQDVADKALYELDKNALNIQRDRVESEAAFALGKIDRGYAQQKSQNISQRMNNYVEQVRAKGQLAAQGRRGQSADAQQQSALSAYGRQQSDLVQSLVFASQDKSAARDQTQANLEFDLAQISNQKSKLNLQRRKQRIERDRKLGGFDDAISTLKDRKSQLQTDKKITSKEQKKADLSTKAQVAKLDSQKSEAKNKASLQEKALKTSSKIAQRGKSVDSFKKQQQDLLNENQKSRLESALDATREEVKLAKSNIEDRMGLSEREWERNQDVFKANNKSARTAFKAAKQKLRLDKSAANIAARANVMMKPTQPPALPVPQQIPYTKFLKPSRPIKPPKPIRGAMGKTSIWNSVGDAVNTSLKIMSFF